MELLNRLFAFKVCFTARIVFCLFSIYGTFDHICLAASVNPSRNSKGLGVDPIHHRNDDPSLYRSFLKVAIVSWEAIV
jgi:hypothetical protein